MVFTNCGKLGDAFLCLPVISWYYKTYGEKLVFALSKHFPYAEDAKDLLSMQECIKEVIYFDYTDNAWENRTSDNLGKYHINKSIFTNTEYKDHDVISLGFHRWPDKYLPEFYAEEYGFGVDYDFKLNYGDANYHYSTHTVKVDKFEDPQLLEVDGINLCQEWGMVKNLQLAAGANRVCTYTTGFSILATLARIPIILYQSPSLVEHHKKYFCINGGIEEVFI